MNGLALVVASNIATLSVLSHPVRFVLKKNALNAEREARK
jgi:hypothetical protein